EEQESVLSYYRKLFRYILVDEYQDTNLLQFYFVKYLSEGSNICVVGDDDQSIYSWRGAEIKNILEFEKYFKNACTIKLTKNYRSTQNILDISNKLISNNRFRKGKNLIAAKDYKGFVEIKNLESDEEEAHFVVKKIRHLIDEGLNPNEIAILYRTNAQSRIFETYLTNAGIPYRVIGNLSFYSRKEIKDILAYMKIFDNPFDSESLMRALKNPPSGIGEKTLKKIIEISIENSCDLLTSIKILTPSLSGRQKNALYSFLELMEEIKNMPDIASIINLVLKKRDYENYLKSFEEDNVANKRIYNIYELINAAIKFSENNEESTLSDFLASISLITSSDVENHDAVNLLTVHSAKGLEFSSLFVVGLEEGLFPLYRAYDSSESLEEERRLCYVAVTRAKDRLFLTWAKNRMLYGNIVKNEPSPFLKELSVNSKSFKSKDMFRRGDLIVHKNFGKGVIIEKKGEGETAKLRIMFKEAGTKTIIAKYINTL
ncbi:MAG: 3'-5' exonuclease, partial [Deferribacterota bacterium]|nr:3'-5' exonuclease [Deferribacterota bacterium]